MRIAGTPEYFMEQALELALCARDAGESPIGAVVVYDGEIIGKGYNSVIRSSDPTAHAEIVAMREAAVTMGNYRLNNAWLYVSLEPCWMCYGAMVHARIHTLCFATPDPKGGIFSTTDFFQIRNIFNHRIPVAPCPSPHLSERSSHMLKDFFRSRRGR